METDRRRLPPNDDITVPLVSVLSSAGVSESNTSWLCSGSEIAANSGALEMVFVWVLRHSGVFGVRLVAMETGLEGAGEFLEGVSFLGVLTVWGSFEVFFLRGLLVRLHHTKNKENSYKSLHETSNDQEIRQCITATSAYVPRLTLHC